MRTAVQGMTPQQAEDMYRNRNNADYKIDTKHARLRPSSWGVTSRMYDREGNVIGEYAVGWAFFAALLVILIGLILVDGCFFEFSVTLNIVQIVKGCLGL